MDALLELEYHDLTLLVVGLAIILTTTFIARRSRLAVGVHSRSHSNSAVIAKVSEKNLNKNCKLGGKFSYTLLRLLIQARLPRVDWTAVPFTYPHISLSPEELSSTKPIPYRPFRWGDYHITMGIRSMAWEDWIEVGLSPHCIHILQTQPPIAHSLMIVLNPITGSVHTAFKHAARMSCVFSQTDQVLSEAAAMLVCASG